MIIVNVLEETDSLFFHMKLSHSERMAHPVVQTTFE